MNKDNQIEKIPVELTEEMKKKLEIVNDIDIKDLIKAKEQATEATRQANIMKEIIADNITSKEKEARQRKGTADAMESVELNIEASFKFYNKLVAQYKSYEGEQTKNLNSNALVVMHLSGNDLLPAGVTGGTPRYDEESSHGIGDSTQTPSYSYSVKIHEKIELTQKEIEDNKTSGKKELYKIKTYAITGIISYCLVTGQNLIFKDHLEQVKNYINRDALLKKKSIDAEKKVMDSKQDKHILPEFVSPSSQAIVDSLNKVLSSE